MELPQEFITEVQDIINSHTYMDNSLVNNMITGYVINRNNLVYHYSFCKKRGTLILCKAILKDNNWVLTFELILTPLKLDKKAANKFIGSVTDYFSIKYERNKYFLPKKTIYKTPYGYLVIKSEELNKGSTIIISGQSFILKTIVPFEDEKTKVLIKNINKRKLKKKKNLW